MRKLRKSGTRIAFPNGLNSDEWRLVRLWRCLAAGDREAQLIHISQLAIDKTYAMGASSRPRTEDERPESVIDERYEDLLVEQIWRVKVASGEIDNMREYEDKFWEVFGEPLPYVLLGSSEADGPLAQALAEHYVEFCAHWGLPLPGDFSDGQKDWDKETHYTEEFREFLSEWRERIVEAIEARAVTPEASTDKR